MTVWSILVAILVFGVLIFVHEMGHFITAKKSGIKVNEFALGMGPVLFSRTKGDTKYSLRAIPLGGFCAMEGEDEDSYEPNSFNNASLPRRILTIVAGSVMNLILGFILIAIMVTQQPALASTTVSSFMDDSISDAYLQPGDQVLRIDGKRVRTNNDIIYRFSRNQNGVMDFLVLRDGQEVLLEDVTFQLYEMGEGIVGVYRDFRVMGVEKTVGGVIRHTFSGTTLYVKEVWGSLIDLITGRYSLNVLSGPVGVTTIIGEAVSEAVTQDFKTGAMWLLNIVAFITINLGVFNLLPLPALDGGRLVFLLLEGVRRKPINPKYEGVVHAVGFALIIGLVIFATINDLGRLF